MGTPAERFAYYFDATVTEPFDPSISVAGCPNTPCRVGWKGARQSDGYPTMRANEQTILVHRWLYELHRGPIPVGYGVRHLCNRKCLTLSHLSADTHTQNMADKVAAGTTGRGLSVEQVRTILRLTGEGKGQREIAREIGCTQSTVRQIVHGVTYKEISRVIEAGYKSQHRVVSFFAGCGGLDQGFIGGFKYNKLNFPKLPFEILAAYDDDEKCVETYRRNISDHIEQVDLSGPQFKPKEIPEADVLIGGFPCQDFATCGPRRGLGSDRGRLYLSLVLYAQHHKPKIVVGENVPGLANLGNGQALKKIVEDIEAQGYRVKVWTLFGPDYGVPQNRTRLFIVGVREDLLGFPKKPTPTHVFHPRPIKWAIHDLEDVRDESVPNQSQYFRASKAKNGNGQGDEVSSANEPAYTVRANAKSRVQFHYSLNRRLTVRECARLQTFPDSFVFPHSATANVMQIGNAVPPMLAHIVASSIAEWLSHE